MATRQNQRRKDEEKPEGRAIDRLAQQRGKQLAADKKAQDDAEAAKKAAKPAAQQADKDGKKILAPNDADAVARLPESPRVGDPQRVGGTRVVTQDRIEEKDERRFVRDRDEWNRQKKIQRLEELDRDWRRQQTKSGFGKARFTTTFNGRRARTVGSWQSRRTSETTRSPYAAEIDRLLNGDGAPSRRGGSSSTSREGNVALDWMPQDTSKDAKQRFGASDFFGRDNRGRSSRYAGGYLSAEFRENFINSRMEGLNPGDAGYDAMRRKAEGAWGQAVKQYDRQFMQFGQEKLREQSRLDFQQRRETMMKQQEETRQKQAEEQKKADASISDRVLRRTGAAYDRDARPENSALTNRELEQAAAEAVRNSSMRTGVEARIVIGAGPNAIAASGRANGGSTTRIIRGTDTQAFVKGDDLYGRASITDVTAGRRRGLQVGDRMGGTEMNVARREENSRIAAAGRQQAYDQRQAVAGLGDAAKDMPDLVNEVSSPTTSLPAPRQQSRMSSGGRYAGGGTIVFGDQKTFDAVVAQNQKRLRGVA